MNKIENKEDFTNNELMIIEMALRLYDCQNIIINTQLGIAKEDEDIFELTKKMDLKRSFTF